MSKNNIAQEINKDINKIKITKNALTECVSDSKLPISKSIISLILLLILYFTAFYSNDLINKIDQECTSKSPIAQDQYDEYISSIIYWFISLILLIFLKINRIGIINNFIWDINPESKTATGLINIFSIIITIINISVIISMFITLYKIIDITLNFIKCKKSYCNKTDICLMDEGKNLNDVKYYNTNVKLGESSECLDINGSRIGESASNTNTNYNPDQLRNTLNKPIGGGLIMLSIVLSLIISIYTTVNYGIGAGIPTFITFLGISLYLILKYIFLKF
tara:strand:- start:27 stop:863 length:837 start_codon:yes stop_codon:yes gene_type:complete